MVSNFFLAGPNNKRHLSTVDPLFSQELWNYNIPKLKDPERKFKMDPLNVKIGRGVTLLLLFLISGAGNAQFDKRVELQWKAPVKVRKLEKKVLNLEGAHHQLQDHPFPVYRKRIPLQGNGPMEVQASIKGVSFEDLEKEERAALGEAGSDELARDIQVNAHITRMRKKPYTLVTLIPLKKTRNGKVRKLSSFRLEVKTRPKTMSSKRGGMDYAERSVLASGEWFKLGIRKTGIYTLTYEDLKDMGVEVEGLASSSLNIYGNGHGMLPYENRAFRYDDLRKNAIMIKDSGDGTFDEGDRLVFYAKGPHTWEYDSSEQNFIHQKHLYSDTAFYFLGIGVGSPKRVPSAPSIGGSPDRVVESFTDHRFHELDKHNLIKSGRQWFGQHFNVVTSKKKRFRFPAIVNSRDIHVRTRVASRSVGASTSNTFRVLLNGDQEASFDISGVDDHHLARKARTGSAEFTASPPGPSVGVEVIFQNNGQPNAEAWLDLIAVNAVRRLKLGNEELRFRSTEGMGTGDLLRYSFSASKGVEHIWDVTDPANATDIQYETSNGEPWFQRSADTLREYVAFNPDHYRSPFKVGRVKNQNLHGMGFVDMVIVAPGSFKGPARSLASIHESDGLSVEVVTPDQVYNEFSSGMRDVSAIKKLMKMLYDRAGKDSANMPKYLLLFGDGSFKNRPEGRLDQASRIPTFQSWESFTPTRSYVSDDFFGLLDDNEGKGTGELMDIGVGRLPVKTRQEARDVVDKIRHYTKMTSFNSSGSDHGNGILDPNWRNLVTFVTDDQDGSGFDGQLHMSQGNRLANKVRDRSPSFDIQKIYLDAYQQESTPGGERYPGAERDLRERVEKGALILNYTGHGGEKGWAHERILDIKTIRNWSNIESLPLFVTATCEFSRFDDPGRVSGGEYVILNPDGGGIGLLTTTRTVFASPNFTLNSNFYEQMLKENKKKGRPRLGDIMLRTTNKSTTSGSVNHRNFSLLGDPALRLATPEHKVRTTQVNGTPVSSDKDTIKALEEVTVKGHIENSNNGQKMNDFNGVVHPVVYDKSKKITTLTNDGGDPFVFRSFDNEIYRGKASVEKGDFKFSFLVPKDIAYQFDNGRIAYFGRDKGKSAHGHNEEFVIGGTADSVMADDKGPRMEIFMNSEDFVDGGRTGEDPLLIGKLYDEHGINTVGKGIGHNITATLNGKSDRRVELNDHYQADLDTYKSGKVRYQFNDLREGEHELHLKAWDVYNNSNETKTDFVVANSEELALDHVLNYPNPFTTRTSFYFEHNNRGAVLDVGIKIFTVSGKLVKTIQRTIQPEGTRIGPIEWNGKDDHGDNLGRGVYVYKVDVQTSNGKQEETYEKLVILK